MDDLRKNFQAVTDAIRAAESEYGRESGSVNLVAVGKLHTAEKIRELNELGQQHFAENFVQEALNKMLQLSDCEIVWHFIGSIQSNKTRDIAQNFSWVHSVDRLKIAQRLSTQRPVHLPPLNICLQVNLQDEETKSGISEETVLSILDSFAELPAVRTRGFMIIPRPMNDPIEQRKVFAQLRKLLEKANTLGHSLDTLSMGMTADMEMAIAEGSTHVRIGTALFGQRPPKTETHPIQRS